MIYQPAEDSWLLEKVVKRYAKNKKVLDVGTGSGILALTAKKFNASSVEAIDINSESVKYVRHLGIKSYKSNLFEKVKGKFNLIIFNPPYLPEDEREDKESKLITSGGKRGDEIIMRFFKSVKKFINSDGKILILLSSLTPRDKINKFVKENFNKIILDREKLFMESLEVWELSFKTDKITK